MRFCGKIIAIIISDLLVKAPFGRRSHAFDENPVCPDLCGLLFQFDEGVFVIFLFGPSGIARCGDDSHGFVLFRELGDYFDGGGVDRWTGFSRDDVRTCRGGAAVERDAYCEKPFFHVRNISRSEGLENSFAK